MKRQLSALLALMIVAGCGGGGGGGSIPSAPHGTTQGGSGSFAFTVKVPVKAQQARAHQAHSLAPMDASPATVAVGVSYALAPATPPPANTPTVAVNISTCVAPTCTTNADGSRSYQVVTPPVPLGKYNVNITTWDAQPVAGVFPTPSPTPIPTATPVPTAPPTSPPLFVRNPQQPTPVANMLSDVSTTVAITGANTNLNVTLNGIPASVSAVPLADQSHVYGELVNGYNLVGNGPTQWSVVGLDADGYIIAGNGAPVFTFSDSVAGAITVTGTASPFTFTGSIATVPPQTNAMNITAKGLGPSGITSSTASIPILVEQEIWTSTNTGQGAGGIYGWEMSPNSGFGSPTNAGPADIVTSTDALGEIAQDSAGFLWVYDATLNQITQYQLQQSGPPVATGQKIAAPGTTALACDNNGYLYATNGIGSLFVYKVVGGSPSQVGQPITLANGPGTGIAVVPNVSGIPASLVGDLVIGDSSGADFYTNAQTGSVTHVGTATWPNAGGIRGVAFAPDNGQAWVLDNLTPTTAITSASLAFSSGPVLQVGAGTTTISNDAGYISAGISDYVATSTGANGTSNNLYYLNGSVFLGARFYSPIQASTFGSLIVP